MPHPDCPVGGTKKISIFINGKGESLALDMTSGKSSEIWVSAHIVLPAVLGTVERDRYPLDKALAVIDYFAAR